MANFMLSTPSGPAPGPSSAPGVSMDAQSLTGLNGMTIVQATATIFSLERVGPDGPGDHYLSAASIGGAGLTYDKAGQLSGGVLQNISLTQTFLHADGSVDHLSTLAIDGFSVTAATAQGWLNTGDTAAALSTVLAGNDVGAGSDRSDLMRGFAGDDTITAGLGNDTVFGGLGDDQIAGGEGSAILEAPESNYLRGDEGADTISGGIGFDDINGNRGDDVLHGNAGDDWVVGGKDNDVQFGDAGGDIVWGNLGNDTLDGGDGTDQVRGGQGDDVLTGGAGNDYVSGDRGNDTESGGAGADIFHGSQDAGVDRVLDFHLAEGDRVMLDPGTNFTLRQAGADTIIDTGGDNEMILVGVQMSSLPPGTIFFG